MNSNISSCLNLFEDLDKDRRYMAVSDLHAELDRPDWWTKVNQDEIRKIHKSLLVRLDDTSGDISALAVKWFASRMLCLSHNTEQFAVWS
jgi:hypothetical protein